MLGKTHMVVGVAVSLAVTQPADIPEMVLAVIGGALGALISDIDVETSVSRQKTDKITKLSILAVLAVILLDKFFYMGIAERVLRIEGGGRIAAGVLLFIAVCAFGKRQPHRSFMHSFLAMFLLCLAIGLVWEKAVIYFALGFLSHLAIDILNKRRVQLLYPFKGGVALGLFYAQGLANNVLFVAGSVVAAAEVVRFSMRLLNMR